MKVSDKLFKETLARVGKQQMTGVIRLMTEGHYGIAERHTVGKLFQYVERLEKELGVEVSIPEGSGVETIKINKGEAVTYIPKQV